MIRAFANSSAAKSDASALGRMLSTHDMEPVDGRMPVLLAMVMHASTTSSPFAAYRREFRGFLCHM